MKRLIMAIIVLTAFAQGATAQAKGSSYKTALGVKFYPGGGVTLKHFVKSNAALEGIGYFWRDGVRITGLYEFHGNINGAPGLKWYVGPGAHVGLYKGITAVGIDGVVGIDYKFSNLPLNLALDWQPSFELGSGTRNGFNANWGGFAIRFTL